MAASEGLNTPDELTAAVTLHVPPVGVGCKIKSGALEHLVASGAITG